MVHLGPRVPAVPGSQEVRRRPKHPWNERGTERGVLQVVQPRSGPVRRGDANSTCGSCGPSQEGAEDPRPWRRRVCEGGGPDQTPRRTVVDSEMKVTGDLGKRSQPPRPGAEGAGQRGWTSLACSGVSGPNKGGGRLGRDNQRSPDVGGVSAPRSLSPHLETANTPS